MYFTFSNGVFKVNLCSMTDFLYQYYDESTDSTVNIYNTPKSCTKTQPVLYPTSSH